MANKSFGRIPANEQLTQEDVDLIRNPQAFGLAPPLKRSGWKEWVAGIVTVLILALFIFVIPAVFGGM